MLAKSINDDLAKYSPSSYPSVPCFVLIYRLIKKFDIINTAVNYSRHIYVDKFLGVYYIVTAIPNSGATVPYGISYNVLIRIIHKH